MNTEEALTEYNNLREQGKTKTAALAELASYLHPVTLSKLQARIKKLSRLHPLAG